MSADSPLVVDNTNLPEFLPNPPLLTSHQAGWSGIQLAHHRQPAMDLPEVANSQHIVILPLGHHDVKVEFIVEGRSQSVWYQARDYQNGNIEILPAELPYQLICDPRLKLVEFIHCYLDPLFLAHIAYESVNPDRVELLLELKKIDLLIQQIILEMKTSLEVDGRRSRFYVESLATALSAHLLRKYASRNHAFREHEGGLSRQNLGQAIDYIQAHLGDNIALGDIANELNMSHYYFGRLFKQSMGVSPHQYLLQQRIEKAKQLLKCADLTITAVALQCGFNNPSHLAKQFRQRTGLTPKQFRDL